MIMQNKRGQGLSTNAIILIVLGVAILVVLIFGFIMGWENIAPWLSGDNVDTIANQCEAACSTRSVYDFCTKQRELKASDLPGGEKSVTKSCFEFSIDEDYNPYGIEKCPGLCPPTYVWVASEAECVGEGKDMVPGQCDADTKPGENSICCRITN